VATIATLAINIIGNTQGLDAALSKAQQSLRSTGANLVSLGGKMTAGVSLPILGIGGAALKAAADNEQLQVAFTTMLGSAEKAKTLMADLAQFAAATPFESSEIQQASKMLLAYGSDAGKLTDEMRQLGDIAAGVGVPLQDMAYLYGTARVQGRLFTADINQFTTRGIPIMEALAETMGVAQGEIRGMVEEGKVGFPELQAALGYLTGEGGKFSGLMAAQSVTLSGLFSTLKDNVALSMIDIGNAIAQAFDLKGVAAQAIAGVESIRNAIADLAENNPALLRMGVIVAAVVAAIGPLLVGLGMAMNALAGLAPIVGVLGAALGFLVSPLGLVAAGLAALVAFDVGGIRTTLGTLAQYLWLAATDGDALNDFLSALPGWMQPAAEALGRFVAAVGELVQTGDTTAFVENLRTSFPDAAAAVDGAAATIQKAVDATASAFGEAQGAVNTFLATDTWSAAQEQITASLGAIGESFAGLFTGDVSLAEFKDTLLAQFGEMGTALGELLASDAFAGLGGGLLAAFGLEGLPAQITAQVDAVKAAFQPLTDFLAPAFDRLKETVGGLPEQFGALGEKFGPLKEAALQLAAAIGGLFSGGGEGGAVTTGAYAALLAGSLSLLTNTVNGLLGALAPLAGAFIDELTTVLSGLSEIVTGLGTAFNGLVTNDPTLMMQGLGQAFQGVKDIVVGSFENSLTVVQTALGAIGEIVSTTLADWGFGAAATAVEGLVTNVNTLLEKIKAIASGDAAINFAAPDWIVQLLAWLWPELDLPAWAESLLSWQWPEMSLPEILDGLLAWDWPSFPSLPSWVGDLLDWDWPSFEMPGWLNDLFAFKWPSLPSLPPWLGGPAEENKAVGTSYFGGGLVNASEVAAEVAVLPRGRSWLPRGTQILNGRDSEALLAGGGGGVSVIFNHATLRNERDVQRFAREIADIQERRRRG
jgi:tape measure domain-containing protein